MTTRSRPSSRVLSAFKKNFGTPTETGRSLEEALASKPLATFIVNKTGIESMSADAEAAMITLVTTQSPMVGYIAYKGRVIQLGCEIKR